MAPMQGRRISQCAAHCILAATIVSVASTAADAAVIDLYPPNLSPLLTLAPGDTAILHAGTYNRVYTGGWTGGSAAGGWITIKGAEGEARPLILYTGGNNVFEMPSVSYMKFQNLEIQGGSDTFKFTGTCHDIILDNIYMHDVYDGFVNASGIIEMYNLTVRNCEIARVTSTSTGEAFYLGGHEKTYQPQVHDSLIERNFIHDVTEGVELKAGCTRITVQDNVISANRGAPSMTIYGTYKTDPALGYAVRRNFIYSSTDSGIQCTSDAVITNNVIVNSSLYGLSIRKRNLDAKMQNITIANNTFCNAVGACLQVSNGDIATNVVIANNAVYQNSPAATAFNAAQGAAGITLANNLYYGTSNVTSPGLVLGPAPASLFVNAATTLAQMDVYPLAGGLLIDAADATYAPAADFNLVARAQGAASDIGAYEASRSDNPGWKLAPGFRSVGVPGDTNLDSHIDMVDLLTLSDSWGLNSGAPGFAAAADLNKDGLVDVIDLLILADNWGQ